MNIIKINHYIECSKILKLYMKINGPLLNAIFISRPNRFITMVKINNKKENYLIFSDEISYFRNDELIFANGNSRAISEGIEINAEIFNYNEKKDILEARGKVKIEDKIEDYILESDYINYDRNSQKIFTKGKTKTVIEKKYEFNSKDVFLDRNLKELKSNNFSTVKDDNSNFYKLSKFLYFYDEKLLRGNDIEVETNFKQEKSDKFFFKNAFINFLDNSYISKDTRINIHKKVFDKERDLEENEENIFIIINRYFLCNQRTS